MYLIPCLHTHAKCNYVNIHFLGHIPLQTSRRQKTTKEGGQTTERLLLFFTDENSKFIKDCLCFKLMDRKEIKQWILMRFLIYQIHGQISLQNILGIILMLGYY